MLDQLLSKTLQVEQTIQSIRNDNQVNQLHCIGVEYIFVDISLSKLEGMMMTVNEVLGKILARQFTLQRDLNRVEVTCREISTSEDSNNKFQALNHLYGIHTEDYIQVMLVSPRK